MRTKMKNASAIFNTKGKTPKEFFAEYFGAEAEHAGDIEEPADEIIALEVKKNGKR